MDELSLDDESICLGHDEDSTLMEGSVMPPLVQTSLFRSPDFETLVERLSSESSHYVYSRGNNPTVQVLESKLAALEQGQACRCFASGMAAINAVLTGLLKQGDHILFVNNIYGPTQELAQHLTRFGVGHDKVTSTDLAIIEQSVKPNTKLIYFESPGTMMFKVLDIAGVVALAQQQNILTAIDNTWATPLFQKPLTMGVDISIHTCTKYLGGHSDVIGGAVIASEEIMHTIFYNALLLNGSVLAPHDAWLLIRSLRTLPARMRQHQEDAIKVAHYLQQHPKVVAVNHPALDSETAELAEKQMIGFSGLFSFQLDKADYQAVCQFINALRYFHIGVSWGGVESLVISPSRGNNEEALQQQGIPQGLIRLSIGLEGADRLIEDLEQAFNHL